MANPIRTDGPSVTPRTLNNQGGGNALPPYLQQRTPKPLGGLPQAGSQPIVTPKSTVVPGEVRQQAPQMPSAPAGPPVSPPGQPPQAGGNDLGGLYKFFQSDLANQAKQATANSISDASARGVYYGTPLTGSEADINTQYLRGLGQLQAGMYGNEQQNQLARLGLGSQLMWQGGQNAPPNPGINPGLFSALGQAFGMPNQPANQPVAGQRQPQVTPAQPPRIGAGDKTQQPQQLTY